MTPKNSMREMEGFEGFNVEGGEMAQRGTQPFQGPMTTPSPTRLQGPGQRAAVSRVTVHLAYGAVPVHTKDVRLISRLLPIHSQPQASFSKPSIHPTPGRLACLSALSNLNRLAFARVRINKPILEPSPSAFRT